MWLVRTRVVAVVGVAVVGAAVGAAEEEAEEERVPVGGGALMATGPLVLPFL